jgi:hypothetical protein
MTASQQAPSSQVDEGVVMADLGEQLGLGGGAEAGEAADGAAPEPEPPAKRARKVALSFPKVQQA